MEKELGVEYQHSKRDGYYLKENSIAIIRYADDFLIICHKQEQANSMYDKMTEYLNKRQLSLSMEKTRVTHIEDGFDFLGFNIRQYRKSSDTAKLLIKPSKDSIKKAKTTIKNAFTEKRGRPVGEIITELNPIIRGTGYYWNKVVSKEIFDNVDHYVWIKAMKYLKQLHPKKSLEWKKERYFKPDHNGISKDKWILTDPKYNNNQITKLSWIPIEKHVMVKFDNSPDNPALKQYFEQRDEKEFNVNNVLRRQKIAKTQKYKCRVCKQSLIGEESLEVNHIVPENIGGKSQYFNLELLKPV